MFNTVQIPVAYKIFNEIFVASTENMRRTGYTNLTYVSVFERENHLGFNFIKIISISQHNHL